MLTSIKTIDDALTYNAEVVEIEEYWNLGEQQEHKIHSIHAYPAKFPAFIATKAINYARAQGMQINKVADIFCGCGTVALEAKINNIDFWGCDINPVATLIALAKIYTYDVTVLINHYNSLIQRYDAIEIAEDEYINANERLAYWFDKSHYLDLKKLLAAINELPNGKYKQAFKCIFSSILKSTSRWLGKSIKPQIDPDKNPIEVKIAFKTAYTKFLKAIQAENINTNSEITIENSNFLTKRILPKVSLIITSPPYVTSYEYADLHQLSSLWLGYTDDYKELRNGTIGSVHNSENYYFELMDLNNTGRTIVENLRDNNISASKVKSVARYYLDMQRATQRCYNILEDNGMAFFIIGDTQYKGVKVENSRHLVESLIESGFAEITIAKRRITKKLLTPYRDEIGRFTTDKSNRKIYHEEFVVTGKKVAK